MWHAARVRARSLRVVGLIVGVAVLAGLAPFAFARSQSRAPGPWLRLAPSSGPSGTWVWVRGADFRPRGRGIVLLGARRVASFRATRRGTFRAGFVVPGGAGGVLRVAVVQTVRGPHGRVRRLDRVGSSFRVLVGGAPAGAVPGGASVGSAGGAGSAPVGGSPGGGGGGAAPATPATKAPPSTGGGTGGGSTGGGSTGGGSGGGTTGGSGGSTGGGSTGGGSTGGWWVPPKDLTWYWQLQGTVNNNEPVAAYDIDGFENAASEVTTLHAKGIHVICYIDVGTYEPGRPDSGEFPASVKGSAVQGWPGEQWLNIADTSVLEPIMTKRFQMCKEKGFDAVEPDNMDGFENDDGFNNTALQQLTYDEWVATEVHALGMAVLQKNDGGQTNELKSHFDGALTEECNVYSECASFTPYLAEGKPVLNAEYSLATSAFCSADNAAGIMGARYDLELDGKTFEPCW